MIIHEQDRSRRLLAIFVTGRVYYRPVAAGTGVAKMVEIRLLKGYNINRGRVKVVLKI